MERCHDGVACRSRFHVLAAVPRLIGFAIILIVGWIIASLIEKAVVALLRAVRFNVLAERSGLAGFNQQSNMKDDAAGAIGLIATWFVRLIALVVAFDALGLLTVSEILHQPLLWLPNLVVALLVLVIDGIAANALGNLVRGAAAEGGVEPPDFLAKVARYLPSQIKVELSSSPAVLLFTALPERIRSKAWTH